jgi:hypothetical protein
MSPETSDHLDDDAFESRMVWILGSPRTGSTWLLQLLIHPWKLTMDGQSGLKPPRLGRLATRGARPPAVVPVNESYLPAHLTPIGGVPESGIPASTEDLLLHSRRAGDASYFFARQYRDVWHPEVRRMAIARFRAQAERAAAEHSLDDPLVLIKEPNGSHGAELLMSLFPRSRLIFLARDGRDVVDSMLDASRRGGWLGGAGGFDPDDQEARLRFVRTHAILWANAMTAVQSAFDGHSPELRRLIRYEDLRADTFGTLKPLSDWLGLGRTDRELRAAIESCAFEAIPRRSRGAGKDRRAAQPGLWRENLSPADQRVVEEVAGAKLAALGYETRR